MNEPTPAESSDSQLADFIGWKKAASARALDEETPWTDEAKRRRKKKYVGELFEVSVVRSTRPYLSTSAVVAKLGQAWVKAHSKLARYSSVRATARQKPQA
jgi:hypothetical protein